MAKAALLLVLFAASAALGQSCDSPENNQFDFWVGEWEVYNKQGNKVGENSVLKQYNNCLIQESWVSTGVNKGTSYNYYNPADSTWNQVWIDNQGGILNLTGQFQGNKMVLKSSMITGSQGQGYYNQISWVNNSDGTVNQVWEIMDNKGNVLQTAFYGIYKPKENK